MATIASPQLTNDTTEQTRPHIPPYYTLLGMVCVFQENRVRIHVKFVFAWKTVRLFPTQTKRKHNKIILSVFTQKWKTGFLFWIQTDGIILLCFLFVCVGNSLHVFQANTNFTCILTLFSWNTGTIPSSDIMPSPRHFPPSIRPPRPLSPSYRNTIYLLFLAIQPIIPTVAQRSESMDLNFYPTQYKYVNSCMHFTSHD